MTNTAVTGATYDVDGGQQLIALTPEITPPAPGRGPETRPGAACGS